MSKVKTVVNSASIEDFIASVQNKQRQKDSLELLAMFKTITGETPRMWGASIIGFGERNGWPLVAFSPRKQNLTLYVMPSTGSLDDLLHKLGKHKASKACLYINKLTDIDKIVLAEVIERAYRLEQEHQQNNYLETL